MRGTDSVASPPSLQGCASSAWPRPCSGEVGCPDLYTWGLHRHRNKGRKWVTARYFSTFNKSRNDKWVFGDRRNSQDLWIDVSRGLSVAS